MPGSPGDGAMVEERRGGLWSDFLRRLMVTASLAAPAVNATVAPQDRPAEIGDAAPHGSADAIPPRG